MKKILVIGIKGMAGHMLFQNLGNLGNYELYGIARNIKESTHTFNLDISDTKSLQNIIEKGNFDCIVNCIGILNRDAEDNPEKAIWFNSYFPHFLEKITKNTNTKIIHISTDCVFNGKRGGYTENDIKDGVGFYAKSKALGEITNNKDLTIRTSIIGPELNQNGIGLFHWFMMQPASTFLKGFSRAYWSGITTLELSRTVHEAIQQNITGLIQIAPDNKIDKFSLLQLFNEVFRKNEMNIEANADYNVDKSMISIRKDFNYKVPDYKTMLEEMKKWISEHEDQYAYFIS